MTVTSHEHERYKSPPTWMFVQVPVKSNLIQAENAPTFRFIDPFWAEYIGGLGIPFEWGHWYIIYMEELWGEMCEKKADTVDSR